MTKNKDEKKIFQLLGLDAELDKTLKKSAETKALEKELLQHYATEMKQTEAAMIRFIKALGNAGVSSKVVNQPNLFWLLEHHLPKFKSSYGLKLDWPIKDGKINGVITDAHIYELLQLYNLLETHDVDTPIPRNHFADYVSGKRAFDDKNARGHSFVKQGVTDNQGNFQIDAMTKAQNLQKPFVEIDKFPNIRRLASRIRSRGMLGSTDSFLVSEPTKPDIRKLRKRYEFVQQLSDQKAENFVYEKVEEADFAKVVEATILMLSKKGQLERLDNILENLVWDECLEGYQSFEDMAQLEYVQKLGKEYGKEKKSDKAFTDFQNAIFTDGLKHVFLTMIYPKSIQNDSRALGMTDDEKAYLADLRFKNTAEGFEAIKREHKALSHPNKYSLGKSLYCYKRSLELELIMAYLMTMQEPNVLRKQLEDGIKKSTAQDIMFLRDRERFSKTRILFEMYTGQELSSEFISPFSLDYFEAFFLPVLKLFFEAYEK